MRKFTLFISKKYNFYYPDFFLVNILFGVAITSKKHKYKGGGGGVTVLFYGKTTT